MSMMSGYKPHDGDPVLPLFSLKGKTAIVTGGGAGIGYAVAECFAEAGADVIIWYNTNAKAHEAAGRIANQLGVKCKAFKVDVTDQPSVEKAVEEQVEHELGGRLDIFVANAGILWTRGGVLESGQEGVGFLPLFFFFFFLFPRCHERKGANALQTDRGLQEACCHEHGQCLLLCSGCGEVLPETRPWVVHRNGQYLRIRCEYPTAASGIQRCQSRRHSLLPLSGGGVGRFRKSEHR